MGDGRTGNTHVYLLGARLAEHLHDTARGRTAHDGVVHDDQPLALDDAAHRREFHPYPLLPQLLRGLDEGTPHVFVLDKPHLVGNAARLAVTDGGTETRIGHAHHDIGIHRGLLIEHTPGLLTESMDVRTLDIAVGTGEIDILHRAHVVVFKLGVVHALQAVHVDDDHLAGSHVADELGSYHLEGAGFAADHVAVAEFPYRERPQAVLVAACVYLTGRHDEQREGPLDHVQRFEDGEDAVTAVGLLLDEVGEYLAVGSGVEQTTTLLKERFQLEGVDEIAVMSQREVARTVHEHEGLDIVDAAPSRGRVAHVSYRHVSRQRPEVVFVEDLRHESLALDTVERAVVHAHDAAPFLAAVLERMKSVIGERRGLLHAEHAEHATLLMDLPVLIISHLSCPPNKIPFRPPPCGSPYVIYSSKIKKGKHTRKEKTPRTCALSVPYPKKPSGPIITNVLTGPESYSPLPLIS